VDANQLYDISGKLGEQTHFVFLFFFKINLPLKETKLRFFWKKKSFNSCEFEVK